MCLLCGTTCAGYVVRRELLMCVLLCGVTWAGYVSVMWCDVSWLCVCYVVRRELVMCFHVDDCSDKDAAKFKDLLLEFGLKLHVNVPTHRDGHTLDLFITRMSNNTTLDEPIASYYTSDHTFVVCQLNTQSQPQSWNISEIQTN